MKEKEVQIEDEAHVPPTGMSPGIRDLVSVEYLSARPLSSSRSSRSLSSYILRSLAGLSVSVSYHRWARRPSDVCGCEKIEDRLAAPLIGEQLRNFGTAPPPSGAWELLGLLHDGCPEGFLLAQPLGAALEQMFTGLDAVLAPPAFRVRASGRPLGGIVR